MIASRHFAYDPRIIAIIFDNQELATPFEHEAGARRNLSAFFGVLLAMCILPAPDIVSPPKGRRSPV